MYTIKQASRLTGVSETPLRGWGRRSGVVVPGRPESGSRLYDEEALAAVSAMRRLVAEGWSAAKAAEAVRSGTVPAAPVLQQLGTGGAEPPPGGHFGRFLGSAPRLGNAGGEEGPRWGVSGRVVAVRHRHLAVPPPARSGGG